jgi:hypothetical protein
MQPFFRYFGGKWQLSRRYGAPRREHVIEPFAGAAGYSVFWEPPEVTLIELNPVVYGVWKFLQRVSPAEVLRLPSNISHVDELPSRVCQEAKWLIGFWFNDGLTKPAASRSNWARRPIRAASYWSESIKRRIASQLDNIRHWKITEGSYHQAPNVDAHWHIDPPYDNSAGRLYPFHSIDRGSLAHWCQSRRGWVQVCGNDGATWLPFRPASLLKTHRGRGYSVEALYEIGNWSRRRGNSATDRRRRRRRPSIGHRPGAARVSAAFGARPALPARQAVLARANLRNRMPLGKPRSSPKP